MASHAAPPGLKTYLCEVSTQGLTPLATLCRPSGAESRHWLNVNDFVLISAQMMSS